MRTKQIAWKPSDILTFVKDYLEGQTNFQLANKYEASPDQVKRYIKRLRDSENLPSRNQLGEEEVNFEYKGTKDFEDFKSFMSRTRTEKEILIKFPKEILSAQYDGYQLIKNLNDFHEVTWSLLPIFKKEISLKPKLFTHQLSKTADGESYQAYLLVNIPESVFDTNLEEEIRLVPLFDVHLGHFAHKHEKFLAYLKYIEETPNVYTWLGGDICENALDDGRGYSYDQMFGPTTQMEQATYLLSRIAHKILFSQPGNHEYRTFHHAGIDPTKVIADALKVPYFDGPVFCSIVSGEHKWRIYSQHGTGNSQTKGGKMNMAGRPRKFTDNVDFFVSGHVHDPVCNAETVIREDPINCRLVFPQQWTVIAPSFLGFEGTYAYKAGFSPPGAGGVSLSLYRNGDYEARLSNRN